MEPVSSSIGLGASLALASGAAWTTLDAIRKHLTRDISPEAILLGMVAVQIPIHVVIMLVDGIPRVEAAFFGWTLVAALVAIAANLLLTRAVQISPLSLTVPYLSFTPVATVATGALLLGQLPTRTGLLGVCVVVCGAFLLGASPAELRRHPLRALVREPGSRLVLLVSLLFAAGNALDRRAVLHGSEPAYAAAISVMMFAMLIVLPGPRRELRENRQVLPWIGAAGIVTAAALLLQLLGFRYLYVAYVDAVKRVGSNVISVLFGRFLFAEGNAPRRLLAVGLMSLGVALILVR